MPINSQAFAHRRWHRLPQRLWRGFLLGLTLGLAVTAAGLMR